jgi:DNA polymerase-3 subunit alpha
VKFVQIINKKESFYDGKVYDLCIEGSHSYNIDNLIVHNSGAGSIVNYALEITKIDPLQYDLLFERFLNPDRGHLPDIDSDFCIKKGSLVFKHLNEKYGKDNCCNILTFGRLQTKAVIKDIAKVLDIPYDQVNAFTKTLPSGPGDSVSIDEILNNPEYSKMPFVQKYPELFEHARLLEGSPRHVSQHPAGIAVTPKPVHEICPTYYGKPIELANGDEFIGNRSQFEKDQCELVGLNIAGSVKVRKLLELPKAA